jgi:hypothetical protein
MILKDIDENPFLNEDISSGENVETFHGDIPQKLMNISRLRTYSSERFDEIVGQR